MKIIKHTFKFPKLSVSKDGELIEDGFIEETHTFTLLHKGMGIFEELSGKPLMAYLTDIASENEMDAVNKFLDKSFIPNLACASYVKIENGKFHNNRATAEEFKKTAVFPRITEDLGFVEQLVSMAVDCILGEQKALQNSKGASGKK